MITVKFLGGAKKSFGTEGISADLGQTKISALLEHLLSIKPKDTPDLDTKNLLVAVNGIDSSALSGNDTTIKPGDVVTIIPIIHGGTGRIRFKIDKTDVEIFSVMSQKGKNYGFLESVRKKFPGVILEGVSSKCILSPVHAKKIIGLSLYAKKHQLLLSKKLQTDILLRFAGTTQISEAIKTAGIKERDDFTIIAIGTKPTLDKIAKYLQDHLKAADYTKNSAFLQKLFKISKKHLESVESKNPLEDLIVEKAAVLLA